MAVSSRPARTRSIDERVVERRRGMVKPHTGRRPGKSGSREDIIRAARQLFAERGYAATTMRAIAQKAQVDSALIHHFFGTKERVFAAAIKDIIQPQESVTNLLDPGPDDLGKRVLNMFLRLWETPETGEALLAVLRSAISHEEAADIVR